MAEIVEDGDIAIVTLDNIDYPVIFLTQGKFIFVEIRKSNITVLTKENPSKDEDIILQSYKRASWNDLVGSCL